MVKNSFMRRSLEIHAPSTGKPAFVGAIPHISGKVGLILTACDPEEVSETVARYKLQPLVFSSMDIGIWDVFPLAVVAGFSYEFAHQMKWFFKVEDLFQNKEIHKLFMCIPILKSLYLSKFYYNSIDNLYNLIVFVNEWILLDDQLG
ncbi:putative ribosomal protein L10-like domain superfamily [Helianthus annuus]|uniref:Uncharacterized protein n=1 Tax=Helianthus annuus TaxID=4232 RepID=A0A9K3IC82_HELAN|nr:hypothetical protein HanXRQr2_Chr08g0325801 [Helianthus annuus]KAJ0537934.1 putative ribosomal protein L10-like domain superfamily [Helianthus annuus]KAJ0545641.1 putative ribosomal protein L10-like domain superfamily [Helianthus annuus]KAJ0552520.1 putative ribosomal protein L10-like domain superfamily [Helianthus annuus]KAJ0718217.1 putative ribosomal protein L10-like domain superfamily [Helianthus annuus]